jgi:stage II sporulation protein B
MLGWTKRGKTGVGRVKEKPENRKTITIKINGKDRPFQNKEKIVNDWKDNPAFQKDKRTTIHDKKYEEEIAAGNEAMFDESFDWILPNEEEAADSKAYDYSPSLAIKKTALFDRKKTKVKRNSIPKGMISSIFFAVFFAVVLGTSFGFILLKMVNTDQNITTSSNTAVTTPTKTDSTDKGTTSKGTATATKKEITTYIVQNNVFSNEDKAKRQQTELSNDGIISQTIEVDGQMFVYIGVASNLEDAKQLKKLMEQKDIAAFAKEISFGGGEVKEVSEGEKNFIENSPEIYKGITNLLTSVQFDQSISNDAKKDLEVKKTWLEGLKINEFKNEKIKKLAIELNEGLSKANVLSKDSSTKDIQNLQQNMLAFLAGYASL